MTPEIGTLLGGKYLVEGVLGQGGMGVVVAARNRDLDQRVAIKCLLAHSHAMPEIVERFTREARAAARIHGEHVARVIDVGRFDDGTPFMVMEYLQGHDLAAELQQHGPLAVTDAVRYVLETCEAVVQAHAQRIVHRDLKPANLFLAEQPGRRPIVKVLDFGISKVIEAGASALTKTASVMGTPYYMSPEQLLSSKNVDERSDIWALGVILYELLVGQPPFVADTAPELVAQVLQNTPQPASMRRPDLPPGLDAVIERCMRSKVEERYANVATLAQALMPFASPGDIESVVAIARVLGVALPEATAFEPSVPGWRAAGPVRAPSHAAPSATAHNLSLSATDVSGPPRRRWGVAAAIGGLAAVAVAIGAVAMLRPAQGSSSSHASAIENPSASIVPMPTPAAPATSLVALAPVDSRPPSVSPAPSASMSSPAPVVGHVPGHRTPASPPPPTAAAAVPPVNPLDMHIK